MQSKNLTKNGKNGEQALFLIENIIDLQDGSVSICTARMTDASVALARTLETPPIGIEQIGIAAQLHNIGKLSWTESMGKNLLICSINLS
jgi:response regulator RpfG family c-di-GMP phosphodiesterase